MNFRHRISRGNLSSRDISLLSKGLKFFSSTNKIDQEKSKRELDLHTGPIEKNIQSQQRFHKHYGQHSHNVIDDWQFTLTEQCETHEQLKERETFRQHRLKTFYPYGLNEKK